MLTKLFDKSATALATGKKINHSTDNSVLFCKDYRLNERAAGLNSVMDTLSKAASRLETAGSCIDSLIDLVELARSTANSALECKDCTSWVKSKPFTLTKDSLLTDIPDTADGDKFIVRTGENTTYESSILMDADTTLDDIGLLQGDELRVRLGTEDWVTLKVADVSVPVKSFLKQLEEMYGSDKISVDITDGKLTIKSLNTQPVLLAGPEKTEIVDGVPTQVIDFSTADAFGFDTTTTQVITIKSGQKFSHLLDELDTNSELTSYIGSDGKLNIASIYGEPLVVSDYTGGFVKELGLDETVQSGGLKTTQSFAEDFNKLLKQIDRLVDDCTYNGTNMLLGDGLRTVFSEDGADHRDIAGIRLDTEALGLEKAVNDWKTPDDVYEALNRLTEAKNILRSASNHFQRETAILASRSDFLTDLSETFLTGAESLTAADLNEAAANETAASTQKELINSVINITLESSASVLSLF